MIIPRFRSWRQEHDGILGQLYVDLVYLTKGIFKM